MTSTNTAPNNVVFDVGNVLVRWSPGEIVRAALRAESGVRPIGQPVAEPGADHGAGTTADAGAGLDSDIAALAQRFFGHPLWRALNRGELTALDAHARYTSALDLPPTLVAAIFRQVLESQSLIPGTTALLPRLRRAGRRLFALTDNVHEIVAHLRSRYDFWPYFDAAVVSAEIGLLKPDPAIYRHLLDTHGLTAADTVFIDDMPANVAGARAIGMHAIQFHDAAQCEAALRALGLQF